MIEPSLALQKAIRARLVATPAVLALVPAAHILDDSGVPAVFPCILIGGGLSVMGDGIGRTRSQVYADLHIWDEEPGTAQSKGIAGAIRTAFAEPVRTIDGHHVADLFITSSRFLRDPDGIHSHGVVSLAAQLIEVA